MDKKQQKLIGVAITLGAIAASSIVYATTKHQELKNLKNDPTHISAMNSSSYSSAMTVSDNEIFLLRDNQIFVLDRASLEIKNFQELRTGRPMHPAQLVPPEAITNSK